MNITFFIGNGFDINLGLKTDYPSFFKSYSKLNRKDMISDALQNKEYWADLEMALGEITTKIEKEGDIKTYFSSKSEIEIALVQYLEHQEERLRIVDPGKLSKEVQTSIQALPSEFDAVNRDFYLNQILGLSNSSVTYHFISFNYTNCLDRIIKTAVDDQSHRLTSHRYSTSIIYDTLSSPFHVHGTCQEGLIMGVCDSGQIKNETFRKNLRLQSLLIKRETNERLGNKKIVDVQRIVDSSGAVILYGLSLGETDGYWWRYLMVWLKKSTARRLVIFNYDERGSSPLASESLGRKEDVIGYFLKRAGETDLYDNPYSAQIVVVNNGKIFNFENVKVEDGKEAGPNGSKK
jgi:hypothetical protein